MGQESQNPGISYNCRHRIVPDYSQLWEIQINGVTVGFGASFEETPTWWAPYHEPIAEAEPNLGYIREQYVDNGRHMVRRIPIVNG